MDFQRLVLHRESCRAYDSARAVEDEKLRLVLEAARLAPSACNAQPYRFTVCRGELAKEVARATTGMGMNRFALDAPILLVISEDDYNKTAALGAKLKGNDYRSIDIGIAASHLTLAASDLGLSTCILGWFDDRKIRELCALSHPVRLVVTLGYAKEDKAPREKKRKEYSALIQEKE